MEKDLLDLSGEDEEDYWLLKNTPKKGVTSFGGGNSRREKSSSRLQIPRSNRIVHTRPPFSPIGRVTGSNSMEQPSPSVDTENVGKENTSGNKFELLKLSVERQQMKKKKKIAGFNLRKSLAWDRAFSTEEGVLDPAELSKITGNACQIGGELLSAIQEEYRESMSASKCTSVSPGLQALEENLFNDLPVNSKNRKKKIVSGILSKYASPSKAQSAVAQKKVVSTLDLRSGSKRSGCPRPPPSSSYPFRTSSTGPANVHTKIPQNRELSVSKVSTTKPDPLTVAKNMKRTTQSPSKTKQSQPTQSKNYHRSIGPVSFSKNTSSSKSKTKSSLTSNSLIPKPSLKQARRNVISNTSEIPSVSNLQHAAVAKSSVGTMPTSDVAMLCYASHNPDSSVLTTGTPLAQTYCSRVGNTQSTVSRLGKPSGLRVPSPSIGYFSQADSQSSHSAGDKYSQLSRSDVCSASRVSSIPGFKKPQVSEKVPGANSKSVTGSTGSSGSAAGFSAPSKLFKFSQEMVKVDVKSTREVESKVSCSSLSSQLNESLQHSCIAPGDTENLVLDGVTICTSEKISTAMSEEFQSNSKLTPSGCKTNVKDSNMSDDNRDEKRKSCCSEEEYCASPLNGPIVRDSMDSPMQGPGYGLTLFKNYSSLKLSNPGEGDICTTNSEDFDSSDVHGQSLKECVHLGNEGEISPCLSGDKQDVLIVYQSTENVAKQPEVLDSFTADTAFLGDFALIKSDVADTSSSENHLGNTESIFVPLGPAEAPDCVQSPCNQLEEKAVSNFTQCNHNMLCDGQAVLKMEKRIEVSDSTEINCEADIIGPFPDCKDWFRESEEQHFSCQSVLENTHKIDVLTRNGRSDKDDGSDMQIDYFTGSPDVEQNMEQAKLLMPSSTEVRMKDKPLEASHEPFSEKLTSEHYMQYNCFSVANTSDVKAGHVIEQTNQLGTSDVCSPAKDVSDAVFSYSDEELDDNSELEDMDLVTESNCSDDEPEGNLELKEVYLVTESELIRDLDEFSVNGILNPDYLEVEIIHTSSDLCGETKTLLSESVSSSASIFGDPERLNDDTSFSRISDGMLKGGSSSGRIEHSYVGKAKIQTDTENDFNAQFTDQEIRPHEKEEAQVVKISPDHIAFATREEESGTPVSMNEAFSVRDDMQPNEYNVLSDDILKSESNVSHASENSSSCTVAVVHDKMTLLDAKHVKKPETIVVKPLNAVPFSDEWLAAIEAAGEEILTLKSGRVQHSPTEKSSPEPGPWSPVKKKNNQGVGPFDCTKYTNKGLPPALD